MKKFIGLVICAMFASASLRAGALGDYFQTTASFLPNEFKLTASQELGYTDNADEASNERGSIFSKTELQLDILRDADNGLVYGVTGGLSYDWYDRRDIDKESELNWNLGPKLLGSLNLLDSDKLMLRLRSSSEYKRDNSDTERTRTEEIGGDILYDFQAGGHLGFAFITSYDYTHYPDSDYSDRTNSEYEVSFAPYYKLTEITKLGLRLGYGQTLYNNNNWQDDSETITLNAFLDYQLSGVVSMHAEAGFERIEYDGNFGDSDSSEWSPDMSLSVNYKPASNVTISLATEYGPEDTGSANRGSRDSWTQKLSMLWYITQKTSLLQELRYDIQDEKDRASSDNSEFGYRIRANYQFNEKLAFYLGYEFTNVNYKYENDRDYDVNEWVMGVSCRF